VVEVVALLVEDPLVLVELEGVVQVELGLEPAQMELLTQAVEVVALVLMPQ
jgi:hypothetical protein